MSEHGRDWHLLYLWAGNWRRPCCAFDLGSYPPLQTLLRLANPFTRKKNVRSHPKKKVQHLQLTFASVVHVARQENPFYPKKKSWTGWEYMYEERKKCVLLWIWWHERNRANQAQSTGSWISGKYKKMQSAEPEQPAGPGVCLSPRRLVLVSKPGAWFWNINQSHFSKPHIIHLMDRNKTKTFVFSLQKFRTFVPIMYWGWVLAWALCLYVLYTAWACIHIKKRP